MAKSGRIDIIQNSQNIANNTSNITVNGIITTSGDSWRGNQHTGIVTVYQGATLGSAVEVDTTYLPSLLILMVKTAICPSESLFMS